MSQDRPPGAAAPEPWSGHPPPPHPSSSTVLVLGVLGLVLCAVVGPFAWVRGNRVLAEIDAEPGRWSGREQVQTGRVLGIVATVLLGVAVLFLVGLGVLFAVLASATVTTTGF